MFIYPRRAAGSADPFHLERFVQAQNSVYPQVLAELRAGQKRTQWMWYIFPQMKGLGNSPLAMHFGIESLDEAAAYLNHQLLGRRLEQCTELINQIETTTIYQILGAPDDMKFRSSMTLFKCASKDPTLYQEALGKFFDGEPDPLTLAMLR